MKNLRLILLMCVWLVGVSCAFADREWYLCIIENPKDLEGLVFDAQESQPLGDIDNTFFDSNASFSGERVNSLKRNEPAFHDYLTLHNQRVLGSVFSKPTGIAKLDHEKLAKLDCGQIDLVNLDPKWFSISSTDFKIQGTSPLAGILVKFLYFFISTSGNWLLICKNEEKVYFHETFPIVRNFSLFEDLFGSSLSGPDTP